MAFEGLLPAIPALQVPVMHQCQVDQRVLKADLKYLELLVFFPAWMGI